MYDPGTSQDRTQRAIIQAHSGAILNSAFAASLSASAALHLIQAHFSCAMLRSMMASYVLHAALIGLFRRLSLSPLSRRLIFAS